MAKSGTEEWRRNADTHKTSPEEVRAAGVEASMRPPGRGGGAGEVLHQRGGRLPYGPGTMALMGFGIVGAIGYLVLYQKARPGTPATEVAKVAVGHGESATLPSVARSRSAKTKRRHRHRHRHANPM